MCRFLFCFCFFFFFFSSRRRHTRYWRDWSSDVCSSDLRYVFASARSFSRRSIAVTVSPAAWQHINLHGHYEFLKQTALLNVDIIIRKLVEMPMDRAIALVASCQLYLSGAIYKKPLSGLRSYAYLLFSR